MRYPFLRNGPDGDVDIEITADGLCFVNEAGPSATIEWRRIRRVRLFCGRAGPEPIVAFREVGGPFAFCCEIRLRDGKQIVISSLAPDDDGRVASFSERYRAFVLMLHERLHAARSRARFRSGLSWWGFLRCLFIAESLPITPNGTFNLAINVLSRTQRGSLLSVLPLRYRPHSVPARMLPPI